MRKRYFSFILLVTTVLTQAQVTVDVPAGNPAGTGAVNTTHRKPFGSYYGFERSAMKYLAREINAAGTITSVAFYCDTTNTNIGANTPVKIFLKEVSDSTFQSGSSVATEETNSTLVFNGTLPSSSFVKNTYTTIALTAPFVYSGNNNLEVIVETNAGGTGNEGLLSKGSRYSSTASENAYRYQYWQADATPPAGNGAPDYHRPNIRFSISPSTICSGVPVAGNAVANDSSVCTGTAVSLSLQGSSSDSGLTYQWQTSYDGLSWMPVPGATSPFLSEAVYDTVYYSCTVSCGSNSSVSSPVYITLNAPVYCYCSSGLGGGCQNNAIDAFSISGTTLNNTGTGCADNAGANYSSYPATGSTTATLTAGQNYTLNITLTGDEKVSVWIDYNQDGVFGIYEWAQVCTTSVAGFPITANLSVSPNAINGITGLRLRSRASSAANDSSSACKAFATGETEDYLVTITGGLAVGIKQQQATISKVDIFPNPTPGELTIAVSSAYNGKSLCQVVDLSGKIVFSEYTSGNNYQKKLDLSAFDKGVYLLRFVNDREIITKKVVLQ